MKVLFVGGTGFISTAVSRQAIARGIDLYLLNRGQRKAEIPGASSCRQTSAMRTKPAGLLDGHQFDVVVDWVAYHPNDIERDLALFRDRVKQFVFISSASVYQKPPTHYVITESTPLANPIGNLAQQDRLRGAAAGGVSQPRLPGDDRPALADLRSAAADRARRLGLLHVHRPPQARRPIIVHGDGSSLWVVTHAEDFGRGFLGLLGNDQAIGHAFHITTDEVLTWNQIYTTIAEAAGVNRSWSTSLRRQSSACSPEHHGGLIGDKTWSVVFDNTKIKTWVPGFRCEIPFREGIRRTLAQFDTDESRRRIDDTVNRDLDHILQACGHDLT